MPRRRGNREGSIYQRKDGLWCVAFTTTEGRRKYYYGNTRDDVRRRLTSAQHSIDAGNFVDSGGLTLGTYLDQWLREAVHPSVRRWTYLGYEVHVRLHIKPLLGNIRLDRLTPLHVQSLINRKLQQGLSPKSVKYIRGTLRTALNQAIRWGMMSQNPATMVELPRGSRYEIRPLTPEEARTFLASIKGDRLQALYSVALTMGLRQGEALGLRCGTSTLSWATSGSRSSCSESTVDCSWWTSRLTAAGGRS